MSVVSEHIRERIGSFLKEPAGMDLARAAVQAFDRCEPKEHPTADDFAPLVEAVNSSLETPAEAGALLLLDLAILKLDARDCLRRLATEGKTAARFNVLAYIYQFPALPPEFLEEIITLGLKDRSKKVKLKAIDRALTMKLSSVLVHLEAMRKIENDPAIKSTVEFCIAMLRDGYQVKPEGDGYSVCVRVSNGVIGRWISKQEYSPATVKQTVSKILAEDAVRTAPPLPGNANARESPEMDPVKMLQSFAALAKANLVDKGDIIQMIFTETGRLSLEPEFVIAHLQKPVTDELLRVAICIADGSADKGTRSWIEADNPSERAGIERFVQFVKRIRAEAVAK